MLNDAFELGVAPAGQDEPTVAAYIIDSLEKYGPASGLARAAFCPGLMPGLSGVAQEELLRSGVTASQPASRTG